ncbi:MAG TPA: NmrA family NAD(P)-binding protein [Candidatus Dietzia intestinigallinarum]|nr:NmrA family NAD(P)-binding protein [Candidatus Dietzia intestinigallinarum]
MTTFAVTGATGHLGGLVIEKLLASGVPASEIAPVVRTHHKGAPFAAQGMDVRVGTYDDPIGLTAALHGVEKIVLISPPTLDNAQRLHQLYQAVLAIRATGVSQLLYVSLAAPEQRAFNLEDVDVAIEHSIRAMDLPFTFMRNSVYLDELVPELRAAAVSGQLVSTTEDQPLNWVARAHLAEAITAGLRDQKHLGQTYELTAPELFTYSDLAELLSGITGRQITHRRVSRDDAIEALDRAGMDREHATGMIDGFHSAIAARKFTDTSTAIADLTGRSAGLTAEVLQDLVGREAPFAPRHQ